MSIGRPSTYSPEIAREICDRISEGKSLRAICRDDDMPDRNTVRVWLGKHEDFAARYGRAHEWQQWTIADEMLEIADDARGDWKLVEKDGESVWVLDLENIQRARLRIAARQWYLSKLAPKKYGDKVQQEQTGPNAGQVRVEPIKLVIVEQKDAAPRAPKLVVVPETRLEAVSHPTVGTVRREMIDGGQFPHHDCRVGRVGVFKPVSRRVSVAESTVPKQFRVSSTPTMRSRPPARHKVTCGAHRKYDGNPCQAKALTNGRCKLHGGMSTGPKTAEGRERAKLAVKAYWAARRAVDVS